MGLCCQNIEDKPVEYTSIASRKLDKNITLKKLHTKRWANQGIDDKELDGFFDSEPKEKYFGQEISLAI